MKVVERLRSLGFKPMMGQHDHVYDWKRDISMDEVIGIGNAVHRTLKGFKVLYKMETI